MDDDEDQAELSVFDPAAGKVRVLSGQCATCIFRPGNLMHLQEGRLKDMAAEARDGFIICHATLPYGEHPEVPPAICRGHADSAWTQYMQVADRLLGDGARFSGMIQVPPPGGTK